MKILLCSPYQGIVGGISRWTGHIFTYYRSLQTSEIELELFPMNRSRFIGNMTLINRIRYAIKDYRHSYRQFVKLLKNIHIDVIHLTSSASLGLFKDICFLSKAKRNHIKTVIHFRFGRIPELQQKNNWEWKLLKKVVRLSTHTIVIDPFSYEILKTEGFSHISFLPNPLSPAIQAKVNEYKDIKRIKRKIVFAGHVIPTKGIYELVKACTHISDISVKIIGEVDEATKQKLLHLAGPNSVWLEITGNLDTDSLIKEMLSAHIFVLPTYTEGFPNVILESMACACPIIATSVGAIPEMLYPDNNRPCGIVIPPRNTEALRKSIDKMLNDYDFAIACGQNAQTKVNRLYSIPPIWKELVSIWKTI